MRVTSCPTGRNIDSLGNLYNPSDPARMLGSYGKENLQGNLPSNCHRRFLREIRKRGSAAAKLIALPEELCRERPVNNQLSRTHRTVLKTEVTEVGSGCPCGREVTWS